MRQDCTASPARRSRDGAARGEWQRPLPGVYFTFSGTPTVHQRIAAAVRYAGPDAVLTGASALRRHGVRALPEPDRVDLLVPHGHVRRSAGYARVHQTTLLPERVLADGFLVAPVARAVADACRDLRELRAVRAVVAEVVQRGLCGVEEIAEELERGPRRGSALLRQVLGEVRFGSQSVPEIDLAVLFRRAKLPPFEANVDVYADDGTWLGCCDAVWYELRAVIEVDSREWHLRPEDWERTMARHRRLAEAGYSVLPFPPSMIRRQPDEVVRQTRAWLARRALDVPQPASRTLFRRPAS